MAQKLRVERWWNWPQAFTHHFSGMQVIKSLQELNAGRLATAGGADEGDLLARRERQVQGLEDADLLSGRVAEVCILESDVSVNSILKYLGFNVKDIYKRQYAIWISIDESIHQTSSACISILKDMHDSSKGGNLYSVFFYSVIFWRSCFI